jgi:LEA14-like dessication related protein
MYRSLACEGAGVMPRGPLRFVVAALAAVVFTAACTSLRQPGIQPPSVTLERVRILAIADGNATLSVMLRLTNPNPFELALDAVACDVTLDARPAASVHSIRMEPLPAGGEAKLELGGRVDVAAVATALMSLGSQLPVAYTLKGTVTLRDGTALPFARKGDIPVGRFEHALGLHP